jgi:dihydroorotate dehydrogenase electron transfer subunit
MEEGDWIGVRGPFGKPFQISQSDALVVGGGVGAAPLRPLVYSLVEQNTDVTLLLAGKTAEDLVFVEEFEKRAGDRLSLEIATDDGSAGFQGLADMATEMLCDRCKPEIIYTCGPELMMYKLVKIAQNRGIEIQASLERFMKCGCGICGTCAMDSDGSMVCLEGPVFTGEKLRELTEFGRYHRESTGMKKEY